MNHLMRSVAVYGVHQSDKLTAHRPTVLYAKAEKLHDKGTVAPKLMVVPRKSIYQHFDELQKVFPIYGDPGSMLGPKKHLRHAHRDS